MLGRSIQKSSRLWNLLGFAFFRGDKHLHDFGDFVLLAARQFGGFQQNPVELALRSWLFTDLFGRSEHQLFNGDIQDGRELCELFGAGG